MHSLKNWLTIKKTAGMAHQTTHTKGKQTDDYSPPILNTPCVGHRYLVAGGRTASNRGGFYFARKG